MTPTRADLTYTALHVEKDGSLRAWCREGWHEAQPGDFLNIGNGLTVEILGPSQIGCGSVLASVGAVAAVFVGLIVAGIFKVGVGS